MYIYFHILFYFYLIILFLFLETTNKDPIYEKDVLQLTCSKSCYNVLAAKSKVVSGSKKDATIGVKWHNDGVGTNSLALLLQWLTTEGNYNSYRGASDTCAPSQKGKSKDTYCSEISAMIQSAGIKIERSKNAVRAKISEIETCYRRANDWINNTGAGVDCQQTLQNYVKKLCPYYYDVHEVFMDRASSFAAYTSERNFDDSSESSNESGTDMGSTGAETDTMESTGAETGTDTRKSPSTSGSQVIDVDFTPKQTNRLSLLEASAATKKMIRTGSGLSDPRSFMAEYYQSKAKMDTIRQDRDLKVQEETLKLEKAKFEMERKRLKMQENKSLIESYAEISKMNFETLKMRQKMKSESEMSEDEIAALFPLLEYPPKPSWS